MSALYRDKDGAVTTSTRFGVKCDNRSVDLKVKLRQRTIAEAGLSPLRVLDLCAGLGLVWGATRRLLPVEAYVASDLRPRIPGCLKGSLEPHYLSAFDLSKFNVIDIDTYGEPWEAFSFLAPRITQRTAVFLTHGFMGSRVSGARASRFALGAMGIPGEWWAKVPPKTALVQMSSKYALHAACDGVIIIWHGVIELTHTHYHGVVVDPKPAETHG